MAVTFTPSNHYLVQRLKGEIRCKAQLHDVSLTFADATNKITLPSSAITAGFVVGDRIITNSANAGNQGPFTIIGIGGAGDVELTVDLTSTGGVVAFTDGTENNLTIGTYMVKVLLMRSGFVFNRDDHATLLNLTAATGAFTPTFVAATSKITRGSGSFITDGFVAGNQFAIANSASNNGTLTISTVSALEVVVNEAVVNEVGDGDETMTADDELATGNGYTQDTKLTGIMTITEDDSNNVGDADFPTVTWTASVGSIGPSPGAILYDDASTDNTIIGYYAFSAEETATVGTPFNLAAGKLRTSS
jgi:hypothetical protein